jgi:hypothetical protein
MKQWFQCVEIGQSTCNAVSQSFPAGISRLSADPIIAAALSE